MNKTISNPRKSGKSTIADLNKRISIRQILDHLGIPYNQSSDNPFRLRGICPICHRTLTRSFSVNLKHNNFQCYACKQSGNAVDLYASVEKITIIQSAKILTEIFKEKEDDNEQRFTRYIQKQVSPRKHYSA